MFEYFWWIMILGKKIEGIELIVIEWLGL